MYNLSDDDIEKLIRCINIRYDVYQNGIVSVHYPEMDVDSVTELQNRDTQSWKAAHDMLVERGLDDIR